MADEYLARLGIDTGDMRRAIEQTITLLGELEDHFGSKIAAATSRATAALEKHAGSQRDAASGARDLAAASKEEGSAFDALKAKLDAAAVAYRDFKQGALTGEGGGKSVAAHTSTELENLVAISKATTSNFVSDSEKRLRAEADVTAGVIREVQAQVDARARAASATLAQMDKADAAQAKAAQAQTDRRYRGAYGGANAPGVPLNDGEYDRTALGAGSYRYASTNVQNVSNARNSASTNAVGPNAGFRARQQQQAQEHAASVATLSDMGAYYAALEKESAAQTKVAKTSGDASRSLPRLRYAMYDVSVFAGTMGAALAAGGVLIERTAVQYEQAFASVARTAHLQGTQAGQASQLKTLRTDLVDLSTQIPVTYADITKIATLGNQLNIPAADLSSFTKTVAQFSASTNVDVDAAATAFGRLGQIFNTTNYRGIGDEIAYLGVNAVATEADIIKVTGQIAVSANAYGYTEKQTLALATAYASLGVRAESARGTTVRAFSQIGAASAMGGAKLDEIAKVSGMTTAGFKKAWETDASGAFTRFVTGLGKYGANAKSVLTDLGITASRDTTNLLLLAQNSNVLTKAQDDATKAAGALNAMFARQTDTVSARLQLTQNNVNALFSDIGQSTAGPIKVALDSLNNLIGLIDHLARDPLAAGGLAITVGIVTLAGALLLAIAGWTQFRANLLAVATVQETLGGNTSGLSSIYQILFGSLTRTTAATEAQIAATEGLTAAQAANAESAGASAAANALNGAAAAEGAAAGGASKLSGALGKAGLIGTMLAFLPMVPSMVTALGDWGDQLSGTQKDADSLTKSILGLSDAAASKQARQALTTASDYISSSTGYSTDGTYNGQYYTAGARKNVTNARLVYNQRTTGTNTPGFSVGLDQGGASINKNQQEASDQFTHYDQALSTLVQGGHLKEAKAGFDLVTKGMKDQDKTAKVLAVLFPQLSSALGVTGTKTIQAALASKTATTSAQQQSKAYSQIIGNAFQVGSAQTAVQKSLNALGKSFVTNGIHASIYGGSLQKVIAQILAEASSGPQAASQMQTLFETLVKGGYASAAQLAPLQAVIRGLNGGKDAAAAALPGLDSLATGYNDAAAAANKQAAAAAKSAAETQKQVRTLKDYGSDLSNVFGDQLDYAFGVQKALDGVSSKWSDIRQREKDAVAQIKEYRAQLNLLNQGKSDDQFYLGIANRYGDTRRAADLRADLAQKNSQITSTQKQLNDAQTQGSKVLKGNSAAAIQNRSSLYDMIDGYKGYISSLATSGASQTTLTKAIGDSKQQFIDQATQIGFSRRDVADLATQFDGFAKVVRAVPRGITTKVTASTSAADKAIRDYKANLDKLAGKTVSGGTIIAPKVQHPSKQSKAASEAAALMGEIAGLTAALASPNKPRNGFLLQGMANQLQDYREQLAHLGGFRSGGWTGDGSPNEVAGLVHGREFVLNQTGAQMIPRAELEAANQGRAPYMAGSKAPKMVMPSNLTVSLSQMDRLLLGQNPAVQVGISPDAFGAAIDGAFLRAGQLGAN